MPYDIRRRIAKQWSSTMVPEEADVWNALKEAGYNYVTYFTAEEDDRPDHCDFTPVAELYKTYLAYRRAKRQTDTEPHLNLQQFGVAFNAVTDQSLRRSRRWINKDGKRTKVHGYLGVKGPVSYRIRLIPGRPLCD